MNETSHKIEPIGVILSTLVNREAAPCQGREGTLEAWLKLTPQVEQELVSVTVGDKVIVLTWLHRAWCEVLQVHPRGKMEAPLRGVFVTRSVLCTKLVALQDEQQVWWRPDSFRYGLDTQRDHGVLLQIVGIPRSLQIFTARRSEISVWRGIDVVCF